MSWSLPSAKADFLEKYLTFEYACSSAMLLWLHAWHVF